MVYGDLQFFDIILFAAIAGFIIYRLRSVLGKRTGFQKKPTDHQPKYKELKEEEQNQKIPSLLDNQLKLETVYKNVSNFDHKQFLDGAKKAFEIIITAFNNGDKKTLKNLVSQDVYNAFEKAIDENTNNPSAQFYSLIIDSVENAKVEIDKLLLGGKDEAKNIINMAEKRADDIVDEANQKAVQESLNKIKIAEQEIEQLANKVKSDLKNDLSALVIEGTQSILKKEVDKKAHDQIIEDLIRRI